MGLKNYKDFKEKMGYRESSNNYKCVNAWGFLGKYQFGKPRLWDMRISIDGWKPKWFQLKKKLYGFLIGKKFGAVQIMTKEEFLNSPNIQDVVFDRHVRDLSRQILKKYRHRLNHYRNIIEREHKSTLITFTEYPTNADSVFITESGLVAGAHLKGMGGVRDFMNGIDGADALDTKITSYIQYFAGYDLTTDYIKVK